MVNEGGSLYPRILKNSSDPWRSPVETFQPKLPVRLNRCASTSLASLRRNFLSARFRSSMSVDDPYHLTMLPDSSRRGSARNKNQRYSPSKRRSRASSSPRTPDSRIALHFCSMPFLSSG